MRLEFLSSFEGSHYLPLCNFNNSLSVAWAYFN